MIMKTSKKIFVYFGNKKLITSENEALQFVEDCNFKNNPHSLAMFKAIFRNEYPANFPPEYLKFKRIELAVPGIGPNRIYIFDALADSLEEHEVIHAKKEELAKIVREEKSESAEQEFLSEAYTKLRGWYEVYIEYAINDFRKGGHKWTELNGRVIADSIADAYKKGCEEIEKKDGFFEQSMRSAEINYIGVLTDEYLLENE